MYDPEQQRGLMRVLSILLLSTALLGGCRASDCCARKYANESDLNSKLRYECVVGSEEIGPQTNAALDARIRCEARHGVEMGGTFDDNSLQMDLLSACELGAEAYLVTSGKEKVEDAIASCNP